MENNLKIPSAYSPKYNHNNAPDFVKKFARNMERQFIDYMIEKMDGGNISGEQDDSTKAYYKSLLRNERAELMSQVRNGLGIQEMIVNDYMKKFHQPTNGINNYPQKGGANE